MKKNLQASSTGISAIVVHNIGKVFCIIATIIPVLILVLMQWNYELLLKITPDGIVMNPLSSICFIITGISLWIVRDERQSDGLIKFSQMLVLIISAIGLIKLISIIAEFNFYIDLLFLKKQFLVSDESGYQLGKEMAPNTAFCFFLLGISILLIDSRIFKKKLVQYLNYAIILVSLLSVYGYLYEAKSLYGVFKVPISFYSTLCFLIFSSAVLFFRPNQGSMAILIGENPTEVVLLRFIALVLPLIFGWLKIEGENLGLYSKDFGTALLAVLSFAISMIFIELKSSIQYKLRKAKAKIVEIIREDNERLKRILDNSPTYINIYDIDDKKMFYSNNVGQRTLGYPEPITSTPFSNFVETKVYPEDRTKFTERMKSYSSFKDNEYYPMSFRVYDVDGRLRWLYSRAMVYKRVKGEVKQVLTNTTDVTKIIRVQEELKERNLFIEKIAKASPNIIFIYDLNERRNIYANRNIIEIIEFAAEDIQSIGDELKLLYSLIHPEDLIYLNQYHENFKTAKDAEVREIEYRIKDVKGNWKWLFSRDTVFLRDEKKNVKQIIGIAQDITKRKLDEEILKEKNKELTESYTKLKELQDDLKKINAELEHRVVARTRELKKSEEKYRAFIQQSSEGIWRYELQGIPFIDTSLSFEEQARLILRHAYIAESNEKMAQMHGFKSAKDFVGVKLDQFLIMTEEQKQGLIINFIKSGYRLIEVESAELNYQGGVSYFRSGIIGIIENKRLVGGWGTQRDITYSKNAEDNLKANNNQLELIYNTSSDIIFLISVEDHNHYRFTKVNNTFIASTGLEKNQVVGKYLEEVIPEPSLSLIVAKYQEAIQTRHTISWEETTDYPSGRKIGIVSVSPVFNEHNECIKLVGAIHDITERKKSEDKIKYSNLKLKQKNEELRRINKDLDNFIYVASHDLMIPISNIEGLIYALNDVIFEKHKSKEEADISEMMAKSVDKFKRTISDLAEITLAQKSGHEFMQELRIEEVFKESLSVLDDQIRNSEATIIANFNDALFFKFSRKNLKTILVNLLSNSIKYHYPGRNPEIAVETKYLDDFVLLSVKDNGLGFDVNQMKKAFSMFRTLHSHSEGSGVGLYIIHRIISNAGGRVEVDSEKDKGSTFKLYFKR